MTAPNNHRRIEIMIEKPTLEKLIVAYLESLGYRCQPFNSDGVTGKRVVIVVGRTFSRTLALMNENFQQSNRIVNVFISKSWNTYELSFFHSLKHVWYLSLDWAHKDFDLGLENAFKGIHYYPQEVLDATHYDANSLREGQTVVLSRREKEILHMLSQDLSVNEIASALNISRSTLNTHRVRLADKLGLNKVRDLTRYAYLEYLRSGFNHTTGDDDPPTPEN